jgi:DedD protein
MAGKDDGQVGFDPKHRIVGAIILVSLAVIFIPMILDEREPPVKADAVAEIPARRAATPAEPAAGETKVVVARLDGAAANPPTAPAPESSDPPAAEPASAAPAAKTRSPSSAPPAAETAAQDAAAAKSAAQQRPQQKPLAKPAAKGGWVVQVGAFADFDNVVRLRDQLRRHGHAVSTEDVVQGGKKLVRLQVGPFADREAALAAQARIEKEIGLQGVVLAHR